MDSSYYRNLPVGIEMKVEPVLVWETDDAKLVIIRANVHIVDQRVYEVQLLFKIWSTDRRRRVQYYDDILLLRFGTI